MGLTIHPLDVGDIELDASFLAWQTGCGTKVWAPTTCWLILGADRPILVDSSFRSVEDAKSLQYLTCRRSASQELTAQLARHGLRCEDIGLLLHTHVHMDHAGQDHLLPNARILVQRREIQNAAAPDIYPVPFYDRLNIARLVYDHWTRVEVLDGEVEIAPGIRCVPMPGHTPGHQAIYVAAASGTAIIAGDAAMSVAQNVRQGIAPGFLDDMAQTMAGLRRLARDGRHILPTHDAEVFQLYPEGVT
jgi:glyoxylase-like metal-dependent hydrolase (beta-lactamase superfamily II)